MAIEDIAPPLEGWKSYEYFPGGHHYRDIVFLPVGGPDGRPCIWADDSMWSIDTPENPRSILFLLHYCIWANQPPVDLRGAELRFWLRGENLALHGARCHFWVVSNAPRATRWHFTGNNIPISDACWGEETVLKLTSDPAQWHRSFASDPETPLELEATLATCFSYGFSFVGFSEKVAGRVALADFRLLQKVDPCWPYVFDGQKGIADWWTVSRKKRSQIVAADAQLVDGEGDLPPENRTGLFFADDFMAIAGSPVPFVYLAFLRAGAVGRHDLRNALLMCRHDGTAFHPMGGKVLFFVEHAASGTRWALRIELECMDTERYRERLLPDPAYWLRLAGSLPLEEVLAGGDGGSGYDYLGLLLLAPQGEPAGRWGITHFSIGPTI